MLYIMSCLRLIWYEHHRLFFLEFPLVSQIFIMGAAWAIVVALSALMIFGTLGLHTTLVLKVDRFVSTEKVSLNSIASGLGFTNFFLADSTYAMYYTGYFLITHFPMLLDYLRHISLGLMKV